MHKGTSKKAVVDRALPSKRRGQSTLQGKGNTCVSEQHQALPKCRVLEKTQDGEIEN